MRRGCFLEVGIFLFQFAKNIAQANAAQCRALRTAHGTGAPSIPRSGVMVFVTIQRRMPEVASRECVTGGSELTCL